jgi:hypothetical protein
MYNNFTRVDASVEFGKDLKLILTPQLVIPEKKKTQQPHLGKTKTKTEIEIEADR